MSDYRDDRGAMRQRIEALEAELERATERNQDLEEELERARIEESEALEKSAKAPAATTSAQRQQIAALVAGGTLIVCVGMLLTTWDRGKRTVAPAVAPTPKPSPVSSPSLIPLPPRIGSGTCTCRDAKGRSVRLAYRHAAALSFGGNTTYALDVTLQSDTSDPELVLGLDTVPPSKLEGGDSRFGMACGTDRMLLAFRQRASAWSLADGSLLWSVDLPGAGGVGQGKNGQLRIECDVLATKDGAVTIPRAEGALRLSLQDGSLIKTSGGR